LVRTDAAGATHAFTDRIVELGMEFSVGASLGHVDIHTILAQAPPEAWTPAYNADGKPRDGAWVVEVTDLAELSAWPAGGRLILRKERPVRREALLIRTEVRDPRRRSCRSRTVKLRAA
jgi:hypothetical protein